jgi:alpha-amylase/alpha-mannosidase (GH57 family)
MKPLIRFFPFLIIVFVLISACGQATPAPVDTPTPSLPEVTATQPPATATAVQPTATQAAAQDVLYVNILWHQHQPLYYKDENGVYTRPWVRVHATKDYYDMAALVSQYPDVHVTFNLTPVLIRQLDDFVNNGAKDLYWVMAEKPADSLTDDDKRFILTRFFDANWDNMIARFPRYEELLQKRNGTDNTAINAAMTTFSVQDFLDLQVWFNLAWFDPSFLAQEPLKALVDKGRDFAEADKEIIFNKVREVMAQVIPLHKQLQDAGQIQVITTPYAHPILPLIFNSNIASVGNPEAPMPTRFSWPNDAIAQLDLSVQVYQDHYGRLPVGLWPGEGAVSEDIVPLVADAGYQWMATGEPVLAQSLGIGSFTRDANETVQEADELYRPYYVAGRDGQKVAIFFRDWELSDKIGFEYSQTPGPEAAQNLIDRLENIRARLKEQGAEGPHIVSIILDGENAWEYYPNDGIDFLSSMYQLLSESETLKTITPSEYLQLFPEQKQLDYLFPGAWFSPNYDTWIGEPEENQAWDYLGKVRDHLAKYDLTKSLTASPEAIATAEDYMYLAEGSDWFWWYGSDQNSGVDEYFDTGFRSLLKEVYNALGDPVPVFLDVPIIPKAPAEPTQVLQGVSTPLIDGVIGADEWSKAAYYAESDGSPATGLALALDSKNLYLRLDLGADLQPDSTVGIYLNVPSGESTYPFPKTNDPNAQPEILGISATHLFEWDGSTMQEYSASSTGWVNPVASGAAAMGSMGVEFEIPLQALGDLAAGDELRIVVVIQPEKQMLPSQGPASLILPDLGSATLVYEVQDPSGDDNGPGTYIYPTDTVFTPQVFDIETFSVSTDDQNVIFKFKMYGQVPNPWGSGINLSLQTLDVYIDKDPGQGTGARLLLPGRNAALQAGDGWEVAVWAEGWEPAILVPDEATGQPKSVNVDFKIIVDPAAQTITMRVPKEVFGDGNPAQWGYAAVVLSQDGYPSTGVWRVRDVLPEAEQWKIGGGADDTNHTRIMDIAWPVDVTPTQADMLSTYPSSSGNINDLGPDDFPQLHLLIPQ